MANYDDLITSIDAVIKSNNRREITGQILQNTLNQMVTSLGENYQLAGVATPTTNPHDPDQNVFYIASEAGVYSYFDNIQVSDGLTLLMWKNGHWTAETIDVVTKDWLDANYVTKAYFSQLFKAYDEDGFEVVPNDTQSIVDNIKAMVGLWTEQYLSALGKNAGGGGGGTGDVTWQALASQAQDGRYIDISYLTGALSGYATQEWVNNRGFATQSWVQAQGYITQTELALLEFVNSITANNGVLLFTTNKGTQTAVDLTHEHSFLELLDRPETLEGYGISDAYISDGVIKLGANTITPITSLSMVVPTGFSISGSPVTKTGTLTLSYASGYEGFATSWKNDMRTKVDLLFSMFELDSDGNIKTKDFVDGGVTKHRGLWTESFLSAFGKNAGGGGGGQGDVTWALLASPAQEGRYIDVSYIAGALSGYATQQWVNAQGFATLAQLNALEYYNTITSDMGAIVFTTNKGNSMVVDLSHQHSFLELLDRPTTVEGYGITNIPAWAMAANKPSYTFSEIGSKPSTIAGYGINDAYISDGVIRLGSNTITPITSLAMTVPTGFAVSGSPVSKTGTLAISYASGYEGFTTAWKNDIKDKVDFLYSLFELDNDGNVKTKDYVEGGVTKHRGIWTDSFLSAMGKNAAGGGGQGDVTWALLAAPAQEGRYIDASYITGALSGYATQSWVLGLGYATESWVEGRGYATQSWVNGRGYATQSWVTEQGYATQAALNALEYLNGITSGNGFATFGTNKGNSTVIDFSHEHSFLELLDRPTTVKGYGITDIPAWAMAANKPSYSFSEISGVASASQIPTLDWSKIGTGKPITLSGYGITDACSQATANSLLYTMSQGSDGVLNVATLGGTSKYDIDFSHEHTFQELLNKPTTFGGYGITGGKLSEHLYVMGNVGIGTDSPTHRLTVNGDASLHYLRTYGVNIRGPQNYIDFYYGAATSATTRLFEESAGQLCVVGNIYATQGVAALYTSNVSDIRKKDVLGDIDLSVESVANAPSVRFLWKGQHDLGEQVGSIAQYWQKALPQSVIDKNGELSLQYGVAALLSSIATAKKVVNHEQRIKALEAENERLNNIIANLKIA